ncbi:retron Ec67 family RNA-directed DNA polymerase/endonuclease [Pseudomonas fragi]|uniref:RNA-directed DNA polymerase n=1 Tax=Pseudomonas fragi TaxID=296 RepID=A0A9Q6YDN2_PSEFR|nr:retron Ec67 family RNA-directed DNA polymerase/endonuclease [Pseudomonas fragi]QPL30866.1 RNA-directed DNA polymerase [Pseudomonas fragi]
MSELAKLKKIISLQDLSSMLGFKSSALSYLLYKKPKTELYRTFEIRKKTGGIRIISAPCPELKLLQSNLARLLQKCVNEIQEARININQNKIQKHRSLSHGFKPGFSILTNAKSHRKKRVVLNIDLEDFFGSIHFGRVRGFFLSNRDFNLSPKIATIIAQIVCHNNSLPQGSPCSPIVSNLIAHILDIRLSKLAFENKCSYSRYADDITFSTNQEKLPDSIARCTCEESHIWIAGKNLLRIIKDSWFSINSKKTRIQYRDSRQEVTGLVVNSKLNIKAEYHRTAKSMAHSLFQTGSFTILKRNESNELERCYGTINQITGIFSFIYWINKYNRELPIGVPPDDVPPPKIEDLKSIERTHRKLLYYKYFFANEIPTIVCEGKTDNAYLKAAIQSLAQNYPALVEVDKDNNKILKVKFFKYSKQVKYLLALTGGTGDLEKLISNHPKECSSFKARAGTKPVILVIDNDSGANGIYNRLHKFLKLSKKPDGSQEFYYYGNNLYIVPTPLAADGGQTMIENLFDPTLLQTVVNNKTFNPDEKASSSLYYGKSKFVENVVMPNRSTIDFGGFTKLLDTISKVVDNHALLVSQSKP